MFKWLKVITVIALVITVGFILTRTRPTEDQVLILSDGTTLKFLAVTIGTNHQAGFRFAHLLKLLPKPAADSVQNWFGVKTSGMSLQTSETNLVLWFEQTGSPWGPRISRSAMLKAPDGPLSGKDQHAGFQLTNGRTNRTHSLRFRSWPRREEWIECVIFEKNKNYENEEIGSFKFQNPLTIHPPSWSPENRSSVEYAGDLKVTLQNFAAGIGHSQSSRRNAEGIRESIFRPVAPGSEPQALVDVEFESPRGTNETWILYNADLSDASGNTLRAQSRSGMTDRMQFDPVLWPNEDGWNLRLHMKRKTGFVPGELITFSNVPLPSLNSTNVPGMTNIVMGIESRLGEIRRREPLDKNKTSWSGRDLSRIRLEHDDLGDTNQIDFLSLTAQPSGQSLTSRGSSWSNTSHEISLASIPADDTHLDLVFSIQKARFVEFMVAPNWVTNEFVISNQE